MERFRKIATMLILITTWLIFSVGCKANEQSLSLQSLENTPIKITSEFIPTEINTQDSQDTDEVMNNNESHQIDNVEGSVFFSCARSIGVYNLADHLYNEFITFSGNETVFDANKQEKSVFFTKTTNLSSTDIYEFLLSDHQVVQITDVGLILQRAGLYIIPETNQVLYAINLGGTEFSGYQFRLYLRDIQTENDEVIYEQDDNFKVKMSPNHTYLAIYFLDEGENDIYIYDFTQKEYFQILSNENIIYRSIAWSNNGKFLAVPIEDENQKMVVILNSNTWEIEKTINFEYEPSVISFSNEGNKLLIETRDKAQIYNGDGDIKLILYEIESNTKTVIQEGEISGGTRNYNAIWSPSNEYLAYFTGQNNEGSQLVIYNIESEEVIQKNELPNCDYVNYSIWEN